MCCIVAVEPYTHRQKASPAHSVFQALGALPSHLAVLNIWITLLSFLIIREFTIICVVAGHFFFKSWEVLKFRFFRHIHAYMSFRYRISLSVSTVHTYLKFTLDIYLIPYPFLTATHTHTKKKEKLPCTADNIWNAATPACAEGQVQTGWRLWGHILSGSITPSEECNFELGSSSTSFHQFSNDSVVGLILQVTRLKSA